MSGSVIQKSFSHVQYSLLHVGISVQREAQETWHENLNIILRYQEFRIHSHGACECYLMLMFYNPRDLIYFRHTFMVTEYVSVRLCLSLVLSLSSAMHANTAVLHAMSRWSAERTPAETTYSSGQRPFPQVYRRQQVWL